MTAPWTILGLAFILAALATPLVRRFAHLIDIVDRPDGFRKLHGREVALGGGLAVFIGMWLTLLIVSAADPEQLPALSDEWRFLGGFFVSTLGIVILGLFDDRFDLRGRQKLVGQMAMVGLVIAVGFRVEMIELFGLRIELGLLVVPFTMFWLLGAINSLNLIDGVDGLATTVGVVFSLTLAAMAWLNQHTLDAMIALALAGALIGFLLYNRPPASIFLGDAGSMLIGLVLGVLAIRCSLKGPATVALVAPTALWAIPMLDVGMAIVRRKLTGQSVYATDRGHFHHLLLKRGYGSRKTVSVIGGLCVVCGVAALLSVYYKSESTAVGIIIAVFAALVMTRLFGHSEVSLVWERVRRFVGSFLILPSQLRPPTVSEPILKRFQGEREWESLWETLVDFAERFDLCHLQLNVNSPILGEEYHALWQRKSKPSQSRVWHVDLPLQLRGVTMGRLKIAGGIVETGSVLEWMSELLDGLKPFEMHFRELLDDARFAAPQIAAEPTPAAAATAVIS